MQGLQDFRWLWYPKWQVQYGWSYEQWAAIPKHPTALGMLTAEARNNMKPQLLLFCDPDGCSHSVQPLQAASLGGEWLPGLQGQLPAQSGEQRPR